MDTAQFQGVYDLTSGEGCGSKFSIRIMTSPQRVQEED